MKLQDASWMRWNTGSIAPPLEATHLLKISIQASTAANAIYYYCTTKLFSLTVVFVLQNKIISTVFKYYSKVVWYVGCAASFPQIQGIRVLAVRQQSYKRIWRLECSVSRNLVFLCCSTWRMAKLVETFREISPSTKTTHFPNQNDCFLHLITMTLTVNWSCLGESLSL